MVGEGDDRRRHAVQRRGVGPGDGRALEERVGGDARTDTCANPLVGSDAGQPITKLAALNGVCWPIRISPALTSSSTTRSTSSSATATWRCSGAYRLAIATASSSDVDEHAAAVGAERRPGGGGADVGQVGELRRELGVGRVGERRSTW